MWKKSVMIAMGKQIVKMKEGRLQRGSSSGDHDELRVVLCVVVADKVNDSNGTISYSLPGILTYFQEMYKDCELVIVSAGCATKSVVTCDGSSSARALQEVKVSLSFWWSFSVTIKFGPACIPRFLFVFFLARAWR